MNKNLILLCILMLLGALGYKGYKDGQKSTNYSDEMADRAFTVENTDKISKIKITRRSHKPDELIREGDHWTFRGKRTNEFIVKNMLNVLQYAEIQYIPPKQAVRNVIDEVNRVGIQIDLYDKRDKHFKSFFVGGNTHDEGGTYFLMQGSVKPYVMGMPNVVGGLREYFIHDEFDYLDQYYMRLDPNDIEKMYVDYPRDKQESFEIVRQGKKEYTVKPLYKTTKVVDRAVNNNTVDVYLSEFEKLASESLETQGPIATKLKAKIPFTVFTIFMKNGEEKVLKYYPTLEFLDESMNFTDIELVNLKSVDRFFCHVSDKEIYGVQKRLCKELFKGYAYFLR